MKIKSLFVFFILISMFSCKQDKLDMAVKTKSYVKGAVLFTFGTINLIKKDGSKIRLNMKDIVHAGETVQTGPGSFVTLQIGNIAVIKILGNANVIFNDVASEVFTSLMLKEGTILAKVGKLTNKQNLSFYTQTVLAAVRGTEFQVSAFKNKTTILLRKGKLDIKPITSTEDKVIRKMSAETETGVILNEGKTITAEVKADKRIVEKSDFVMRNISEAENLEVEKISIVPIVADPEKKSLEELKIIEKKIQKKEIIIEKKLIKLQYQNKVKSLINKKTRTIPEMKQVFTRVSRFVLYSGRNIEGAVLYRNEKGLTVLTRTGKISFTKEEIQNEIPL